MGWDKGQQGTVKALWPAVAEQSSSGWGRHWPGVWEGASELTLHAVVLVLVLVLVLAGSCFHGRRLCVPSSWSAADGRASPGQRRREGLLARMMGGCVLCLWESMMVVAVVVVVVVVVAVVVVVVVVVVAGLHHHHHAAAAATAQRSRTMHVAPTARRSNGH
jgi:hypothetical protein